MVKPHCLLLSVENTSKKSGSVTDFLTVGIAVMNPLAVPNNADNTNSNAGTGDASNHPPSVTGVNRVGISAMNRTAIGLSSLSHRERELLS
ncbi:hypothetical protein Avbf_06301 [Armadillidium vulgare]|nr:hypothetical protein Avbf_06301 [Armadillidium vulgare]